LRKLTAALLALLFSASVSFAQVGQIPGWPPVQKSGTASFGVPVSLTSNSTGNAGSTAASLAIGSLTVPAGALIVVVVEYGAAGAAGAVTDGASNSYSVASSANFATNASTGAIFYAKNVSPLSSQTILYTPPSTSSIAMSAFYVTGGGSSAALDLVTTPVTTSTALSMTSGTPAVSGELFVGAALIGAAFSGTYTQASGFSTPPVSVTFGSSGSRVLGGGNLINAGTGTETFAPTFAGSTPSAIGLLVSFKP
jgi:hypothetical protein